MASGCAIPISRPNHEGSTVRTKVSTISASLIFAAFAFFVGTSYAMEIRQFDRMADQDQADYITVLIYGAQQVLIEAGRPRDLADKVHKLFTEKLPGDRVSVGLGEFERNLDRARVADLQRITEDPKARRLEVEDAMFVTLKKNGIVLPDRFFTVARDFRPKHPPKP
jgi:hypothetical protein